MVRGDDNMYSLFGNMVQIPIPYIHTQYHLHKRSGPGSSGCSGQGSPSGSRSGLSPSRSASSSGTSSMGMLVGASGLNPCIGVSGFLPRWFGSLRPWSCSLNLVSSSMNLVSSSLNLVYMLHPFQGMVTSTGCLVIAQFVLSDELGRWTKVLDGHGQTGELAMLAAILYVDHSSRNTGSPLSMYQL